MQIKFRADNQLNLDYLRHIFDAASGKPIRLSLANDFGRMAIGFFKASDTPDDQPDDELTVTLVLPDHATTRSALTRHIYYTAVDTKRLNMILDALFNIDLDTYYIQGIQAGMLKRDIIEAFILSRRLVSVDYTDTLSKRTFRTSLSAIRNMTDILHRKVRYHLGKIEPPPSGKK